MKLIKSLLLALYVILIFGCPKSEKLCVINGKVINRPHSKTIILIRAFEDPRSDLVVKIPVKNGEFSYKFTFEQAEAYSLVFEDELVKGSMRILNFFPTEGEVLMTLYDASNYLKNQISGGIYNEEYFSLEKEVQAKWENSSKKIYNMLDSLYDSNNYYSDTMKMILLQINSSNNQITRNKLLMQKEEIENASLNFTPQAKKLNDKLLGEIKDYYNNRTMYVENNKSLVAYFLLVQNLAHYQQDKSINDIVILEKLQNKFAEIYKDHPYTKYSHEILWNLKNIKIDGRLFDFTLEDITGKKYTLSKEIKGKYALIDIWAPWCGPCIAKSRNMIPIYKEFCDDGFTIVGVAGKYKRVKDVERLLKKNSYPWVTLIDKPEDNNGINEMYGIKGAGGITILVDKNGTIIAINPSVDEVKEILNVVFGH